MLESFCRPDKKGITRLTWSVSVFWFCRTAAGGFYKPLRDSKLWHDSSSRAARSREAFKSKQRSSHWIELKNWAEVSRAYKITKINLREVIIVCIRQGKSDVSCHAKLIIYVYINIYYIYVCIYSTWHGGTVLKLESVQGFSNSSFHCFFISTVFSKQVGSVYSFLLNFIFFCRHGRVWYLELHEAVIRKNSDIAHSVPDSSPATSKRIQNMTT